MCHCNDQTREKRKRLDLDVIATDREEVAFKDVDVALFVGAMPRKEGMERKDLLKYGEFRLVLFALTSFLVPT